MSKEEKERFKTKEQRKNWRDFKQCVGSSPYKDHPAVGVQTALFLFN
ncbi:hypothetical protein JFL43_09170 [Viridibacillus sp. YIM B01967]|uniref:Transposase n=1 Tax=Viridibacillus soli TaxID=2798301 RepID=A0ABS1H7B9_9BACL|nr:hypothetical protein [Viridibacillus soli]MBK3495027.1 hypothetical protein [Viridibacillus soli]